MIASSKGRKYNAHSAMERYTRTLFKNFFCFLHACTHTWIITRIKQTTNRLQSAAGPCRDKRATPCSENNWNQFKDLQYPVLCNSLLLSPPFLAHCILFWPSFFCKAAIGSYSHMVRPWVLECLSCLHWSWYMQFCMGGVLSKSLYCLIMTSQNHD